LNNRETVEEYFFIKISITNNEERYKDSHEIALITAKYSLSDLWEKNWMGTILDCIP
jgi:hypothetical protein